MSNLHILPIRHHGPGSARSLLAALEAQPPAILLVEGPPDADLLLPFLSHPDTVPPIAVLAHVQGQPEHSVFYPLAEFSPEWVAIRWAQAKGIPVGFMDLAAAVTLAQREEKAEAPADSEAPNTLAPEPKTSAPVHADPLALLAQAAAGYSDFERWWDALVESRGEGIFEVVAEVMAAVREGNDGFTSERDLLREAQMREIIRATFKKGDVEWSAVPDIHLHEAGKLTLSPAGSNWLSTGSQRPTARFSGSSSFLAWVTTTKILISQSERARHHYPIT